MDKNKTRPLLVGIVERWRALEQQAFRDLQEVQGKHLAAQWEEQAEWATAHRELTQAETLLWLADQQWNREEWAAKSGLPGLPNASPTIKPSLAPPSAPIASKPDVET